MSREQEVRGALATVRDPELDEPLTDLGFVADVDVDGGQVGVRLRLPTYFCAPNFAYLMVADAARAVAAIEWVDDVDVELQEHFTATEINRAVADRSDFGDAFPGEVTGDVRELADLFARKSLLVRQSRLAKAVEEAGGSLEDCVGMRLEDLPAGADRARAEELREQLGISCGSRSPAFVTPDGTPVSAAEMPRFIRMARLVQVSTEGNAGLCRSLLATRYQLSTEEVAA
jgi:metal-sulfur cluster biosynthetic enzyme